MESGGSHLLLPPGKLVRKWVSDTVLQVSDTYFLKLESQVYSCVTHTYNACLLSSIQPINMGYGQTAWGYMVKPHGQLVLVSFTHY